MHSIGSSLRWICFGCLLLAITARLSWQHTSSLQTTLRSPLPATTADCSALLADRSTNQSRRSYLPAAWLVRGGDSSVNSDSAQPQPFQMSLKRTLLGLWGVVQVISILANAIKRLVPIALQPFRQNDLTSFHWTLMVGWCLFMAYSEGYRAFQLKFSPLVVSRAFALKDNPSVLNWLLAGPYSMGMFNAERKRMIVAWAVTIGVFSLVKVVKFLPYPYRSIVDAGVVVGLSYGLLSLCALTLRRLIYGPEKTTADSSGSSADSAGKKTD